MCLTGSLPARLPSEMLPSRMSSDQSSQQYFSAGRWRKASWRGDRWGFGEGGLQWESFRDVGWQSTYQENALFFRSMSTMEIYFLTLMPPSLPNSQLTSFFLQTHSEKKKIKIKIIIIIIIIIIKTISKLVISIKLFI